MIKQTHPILVQFNGGDDVLINVTKRMIDDDGTVYASEFVNVRAKDADLSALAIANGAPAGRWGNQEVGQYLSALTMIVTHAAPAVPAQDAVMDGETVITPAVEAVAAVAEMTALRFGGDLVVW